MRRFRLALALTIAASILLGVGLYRVVTVKMPRALTPTQYVQVMNNPGLRSCEDNGGSLNSYVDDGQEFIRCDFPTKPRSK